MRIPPSIPEGDVAQGPEPSSSHTPHGMGPDGENVAQDDAQCKKRFLLIAFKEATVRRTVLLYLKKEKWGTLIQHPPPIEHPSSLVGFWRHGQWIGRPRTPAELRAHRGGGGGEQRSQRKQQRMNDYMSGRWKPAWLVSYIQEKAQREAQASTSSVNCSSAVTNMATSIQNSHEVHGHQAGLPAGQEGQAEPPQDEMADPVWDQWRCSSWPTVEGDEDCKPEKEEEALH